MKMKKVTAVLLTSILAGTMTGGCGMRSDPVQNAETLEDETRKRQQEKMFRKKIDPMKDRKLRLQVLALVIGRRVLNRSLKNLRNIPAQRLIWNYIPMETFWRCSRLKWIPGLIILM